MNHISIVFWLISPLSAVTIQTFDQYRFLVQNGFITLPPLTLTSFKAMDVTLKYARFLKIRNMALYQKRTIAIVSQFQYTQYIGSRPVKLTHQYLGVSHLSGIPFSFPIILSPEISQPDYVHVNTCKNDQIMHLNANIDETRYFVWSISV